VRNKNGSFYLYGSLMMNRFSFFSGEGKEGVCGDQNDLLCPGSLGFLSP
jgi:hypothetical protein